MKETNYTDEQIKFILDLKTQGNTFQEIADAYNLAFTPETEKTANAIQKIHYRYEDYDLSNEEMLQNIRSTHRAKKTKSKILKEQKVVLDYLDTQEDFLTQLQEINKKCPIKVHSKITKPKTKKKSKRTVVAHISDTHIGACIDKDEMGGINEFNTVIASRRFAFFFEEVANYKKQHRDETDLVIVLNGDILEGIIHNQEWGCLPMASQFAHAQRIFVQGISYVANFYKSVRVFCTMGNHSRFMHKENKGRQTHMKWDGFGTILYLAIKDTLEKTHQNVKFEIPKTPYCTFDVQGHNFFVTHGDNVINVGNVSSKIDVKNIADQLNDIQVSLKKPIDVAMFGHVHRATRQTLDNGIELMINGSLSGTGSYGTALGIFSNNPVQQLFEVTQDHSVGDSRFVRLQEADEKKELDKIIEPLDGWF